RERPGVLFPGTATPPDQRDRIDVEQQRGRAAGRLRVWVEDPSLAERQRELLDAIGVLVQQEAEIGRRRLRGGDRQQHPARNVAMPPTDSDAVADARAVASAPREQREA